MTKEKVLNAVSGWLMLAVTIVLLAASIGFGWMEITGASWHFGLAAGLMFCTAILLCSGFFTLQPNEACVMILFGEYTGTIKNEGFSWANPFLTKKKISLRLRNLDGDQLKVNDKRGNPIEISAVVVWRVADTARASFDVDSYVHFVKVQSDSAVRHLANEYPYDHGSDEDSEEVTLRSGVDVVSASLAKQLRERLEKAGVDVEEARLNHLAYAPEIAGAMLKRQQAEAIIAARKKIVEGAVSMVDMALKGLKEQNIVEFDEERKAAMVSNLLVVLCGETEVHPVINTGTLHN